MCLVLISSTIHYAMAQNSATQEFTSVGHLNFKYEGMNEEEGVMHRLRMEIDKDSVTFFYNSGGTLQNSYRTAVSQEDTEVEGYVYMFMEEKDGNGPLMLTFTKGDNGRYSVEIRNPIDKDSPPLRLEQVD